MDNIKKFEDFLDRMQGLLDNAKKQGHIIVRVEDLESTFPELKESEDERIRKTIIRFFKDQYSNETEMYDGSVTVGKALAWLEKQKEPELSKDLGDYIAELSKQFPEVSFAKLSRIAVRVKNWIEKQGEQKSAYKVEPKFQNGQWIVWQNKCYKVNDNGCGYELIDQNGLSTSLEYGTVDASARLWNITKDAKDGDVLFHSDSSSNGIFIFKEIIDKGFGNEVICYCDYDSEDHFCLGEHHACCWADAKILHPATKEQRDLLFSKMRESGYEFDFEKKELKKLSQRMISAEAKEALYDKPTDEEMKELLRTEYEKGRADTIAEMKSSWSEEDEHLSYWTIHNLTELKNRFGDNYGDSGKCIDWLKQLKQRIGWKPSDEQMKALNTINVTGGISYAGQGQFLVELYNDLKKLTE